MAQVIRGHRPGPVINHNLQRLLAFWRTVPEQAAEWPEWDEYSRVDFVIEWPIMRETLIRVTRAAAAGLLDERQQCQWQELQQLIEAYRDTVEQMLGEPI